MTNQSHPPGTGGTAEDSPDASATSAGKVMRRPQAARVRPTGADAEPPALDPTRYGDWERKGRCIDF